MQIAKFFRLISRKSDSKTVKITAIVLLMFAFAVSGILVGLMVSENAHRQVPHLHMMQVTAPEHILNQTLYDCGFELSLHGRATFFNVSVSFYNVVENRKPIFTVGVYDFGEMKKMILYKETDDFRELFRTCLKKGVAINYDI